jgi:regulator of sigma E protease
MEIVIKIAQFLLSLSILIILHECGHFFFAKLFKTRVEKFYLFFDPWFSLFKIKKGETEYGIGWIPLGGYVKISGMIDESMDIEQMKQPPQPYEFRSKPAWQRLLIMLGGVTVNFIFALLIYSAILFVWGEDYIPTNNLKYGIAADSVAMKAGLQNGDKILGVDFKPVENFARIVPTIALYNSKSIQVQRGDSMVSIRFKEDLMHSLIRIKSFIGVRFPMVADTFPEYSVAYKNGFRKGDSMIAINGEKAIYFDQFVRVLQKNKRKNVAITFIRKGDTLSRTMFVPATGILGIGPVSVAKYIDFKHNDYGLLQSVPSGISKGFNQLKEYILQFRLIFSKKAKGYESVGGFITMGSIFPGYWDWYSFWYLTALLSIVLAFMNILPIPALDGGHILFLIYEMVTGRKPSDKFLEYAQMVGLFLILALLVYANGNDIYKLIAK